MTDRRTVLAGAGLAIALPIAGQVRDAHAATGDDSVVARMLALVADLPGIAAGRFAASSAVASVLASGGRVGGPIGPGQFLARANPRQLYAKIPISHPQGQFDLPLVAQFVASPGGAITLADVWESPLDPFAAAAAVFAPPRASTQEADWQGAYDRLADAGGGLLTLPAGRWAVNLSLHSRKVHIVGAGRGATVLHPADPDRPVLSANYREGSWNYVTIANLDLEGADAGTVGFSAGASAYVAGDEFSGRTRFENVGFAGFRTAIQRTAGQIGLILESCVFGPADTHILSRANAVATGEPMHAGILAARNCHFQAARQSVARFASSVAGTGGVVFDNCIMERNPGIVFDIDGFANHDMTTDFVVRDCWNEMNGTRGMADGSKTPYARIRSAGLVRFEGTPVGPLSLRNSAVETYACPVDAMTWVDRDADSTLRHHNVRGYGSMVPVGLALSVAAAWQSEPPGRALSFELPDRDYAIRPGGGRILASSTAEKPEIWSGSEQAVTTPAPAPVSTGRRAQRLSLPATARLFHAPVAIPPESWLVWAITYRLDHGEPPVMQVTGDRGISLARPADAGTWQTLGGMAKVAPGTRATSIWFTQGEAPGTVEFTGYCLAAFSSRQDAIAFLNAGESATPRS